MNTSGKPPILEKKDDPLDSAEKALIQECLLGKTSAFRPLVERYKGSVYNLLYQMIPCKEQADDLTQEVFLKAYQSLKTFDENRPFKPWLLRIAVNTAHSALRKKGILVPFSQLEETDPEKSTFSSQEAIIYKAQQQQGFTSFSHGHWAATSNSPENSLLQQENQENLIKGLAQLKEKYRQVLILRYQEELSYEEVASLLEIPLNTARTLIRRGKDKLRQLLGPSVSS